MDLVRPQALGRFVNHATNAVNGLCNDLLARHDLTLPQWVVLSALWQQDGLMVTQIAAYTGGTGPSATRIIDRMVERGLLQRRSHGSDRRSSRIFLTPKSEALRHLQDFYKEINAILLEGFSEEKIRDFYDSLEKITYNAQKFQPDAPANQD